MSLSAAKGRWFDDVVQMVGKSVGGRGDWQHIIVALQAPMWERSGGESKQVGQLDYPFQLFTSRYSNVTERINLNPF